MSTFVAPAVNPTLMSQYGPLFAALVALAGALITLVVTTRREDRYRRSASEDDYRREQRQAIASIAVAGHEFRRTASALADTDRLVREGYEAATQLRGEADAASADLLNTLTVARLLVHDAELQPRLDALLEAWSVSVRHLQAAFRAFWHERPDIMSASLADLDTSWQAFDEAAADLHETALRQLAPLVVARSRR